MRQFQCYELVSQMPYTWAFCWQGGPTPTNFRLFSPKPDCNILTWTQGFSVYEAEVSRSVDRTVAVVRFLSGRPGHFSLVGGLPPVAVQAAERGEADQIRTARLNPFYAAGPPLVKSATASKDGVRLVICDRRERWFYTVGLQDGEWHTEEGDLEAPLEASSVTEQR